MRILNRVGGETGYKQDQFVIHLISLNYYLDTVMTDEKTPSNPSKRATDRVLDKLPIPCVCRFCGGDVSAVKNSEIYNGKEYGKWPWIYMCEVCRSYVGMHPFTAIPLGTLATSTIRNERSRAKKEFMHYTNSYELSRQQAYTNLSDAMGIDKSECHFGWFDGPECKNAITAIRNLMNPLI